MPEPVTTVECPSCDAEIKNPGAHGDGPVGARRAMSRTEDDEDMAVLRADPPEMIWFYTEDAVWYTVSEQVAMAMTRKLIGPYRLERE